MTLACWFSIGSTDEVAGFHDMDLRKTGNWCRRGLMKPNATKCEAVFGNRPRHGKLFLGGFLFKE